MELRSQAVRTLAPENDPLKMGMGWKVEDLAKPQIMVESTYGDSHPGSAHLNRFTEEAVKAVNENGGKAARYFATDMCDGIAQGHDGINYSLAHRAPFFTLRCRPTASTGYAEHTLHRRKTSFTKKFLPLHHLKPILSIHYEQQ